MEEAVAWGIFIHMLYIFIHSVHAKMAKSKAPTHVLYPEDINIGVCRCRPY